MTTEIQFVVPGQPVAKGRAKAARRGNFITMYTPEKTASYENLVKVKAEEAMRGQRMIEDADGKVRDSKRQPVAGNQSGPLHLLVLEATSGRI